MSEVSLLKMKKVPFKIRKELIECLSPEEFCIQLQELYKEFPNEDYNSLLNYLTSHNELIVYFAFLNLKCQNLDLLSITINYASRIDHIIKTDSNQFPPFAGLADIPLMIEALIRNNKNSTFKDAFKYLENWIIDTHFYLIDKENISVKKWFIDYGLCSELEYLLKCPYTTNIKRVLDGIIIIISRSSDYNFLKDMIKKYMHSLSQGDPIRIYIENNLVICDIII